MVSILTAISDTTRRLTPTVSTLALLVLSFVHLPLPYVSSVMPPLALMGVFYWAVYRPDRFGILAAFLIGLLQDLLMGAPLGVTAFLYALAHRLLWQQQRFFRGGSFWQLWLGYVVTQAMVSLGQWIAWSLLDGAVYNPMPFILQLLLALCLYPPIGWLLNRIHSAFVNKL